MPRFRFEASDASGRRAAGEVEAQDEKGALDQVLGRGLKPSSISVAAEPAARPARRAAEFLSFLFPGVGTRDMAIWYRSLQYLLGAGMSVAQAGHSLAERRANARLREISSEIAEAAAQGRPMTAVMERHPAVFADLARAVMAAGEESGLMQQSAEQMADYYDQLYELQQSLRVEMFYPLILLGALLTIPTLPHLVLGGPGEYLRVLLGNTWLLVAAIGVLWMAWRGLTGFRGFRRGFDRFKLAVPWFGGLAKRMAWARWARALSALLKAGVPLGSGLEVASAASGNAAIESSVMAKASGVLEGKPVSAVMAASGEFPATMTDMVAMGERSGDTAQMLDKAAAFCEVEAQTASKQSVVGIATAFYLLVALIIGSTVIGFWMQYAAGTASQIP